MQHINLETFANGAFTAQVNRAIEEVTKNIQDPNTDAGTARKITVSALTCNLINSLKDLTGDRIRAETASGMTVIEWEDLSDGGKLLVDSWFLGLTDINREYNCIEFQK